jgi:hypothetical protein
MTPSQNKVFRPLVKAAWQRQSPGVAQDHFYRAELITEFGIWSTSELPTPIPAAQFDRLLLHFAQLAGDEYWLGRLAASQERRALWRLEQIMARQNVTWQYVHGIAEQMGFVCAASSIGPRQAVADLPAEHVVKLCQALTYHTVRISKAAKEVPF